jgi:hypothetical protein
VRELEIWEVNLATIISQLLSLRYFRYWKLDDQSKS